MKYLSKILIFLITFFIVDTCEIDSNYENLLLYDKKDIHSENYHNIYFKDLNIYDLPNILKEVDLDILSYKIDDKKYYISNNNINELIEKHTQNMNNEDKIYNKLNGFNIDSISVICETSELIKLEKLTSVF